VTNLLEDPGNVGIAGRLGLDKTRLAALITSVEIDPLKEDDMKMDVQETLSTTPCRPP
jgi:hypothetical protein